MLWLIRQVKHSTNSPTQVPKSRPMFLMVKQNYKLLYIKQFWFSLFLMSNMDMRSLFVVIRASVPKLNLDDVFEQKNEIAKAVDRELEKVT